MKKLLFSAALLAFLGAGINSASACDGKKCTKACGTECKDTKDKKCADKCSKTAEMKSEGKDSHCSDKKDGKKGGCCSKDKAPAKS
jgi:hypothetical protein